MYTSYLSSNRLRGGTWTVIPAENNTSFSSVKPSARAHHGEQALRIHDISLPGNVVHSIFPTTSHRGEIPQRWVKTVKTAWKIVLICCLFWEEKVGNVKSTFFFQRLLFFRPHFLLWDIVSFKSNSPICGLSHTSAASFWVVPIDKNCWILNVCLVVPLRLERPPQGTSTKIESVSSGIRKVCTYRWCCLTVPYAIL